MKSRKMKSGSTSGIVRMSMNMSASARARSRASE